MEVRGFARCKARIRATSQLKKPLKKLFFRPVLANPVEREAVKKSLRNNIKEIDQEKPKPQRADFYGPDVKRLSRQTCTIIGTTQPTGCLVPTGTRPLPSGWVHLVPDQHPAHRAQLGFVATHNASHRVPGSPYE